MLQILLVPSACAMKWINMWSSSQWQKRRIEKALRWDFSQCRLTINHRCSMDLRRQSLLTCPSPSGSECISIPSPISPISPNLRLHFTRPPAALLIEAIPPERSHFFIQVIFRPLLSPFRSLFDELFELINTLEAGWARGSYTIKGKSNVNRVFFSSKMFLWSGRLIWDTVM